MSEDQKISKRKLRSSYLSTIISISLVLFMLGLLGMIVLNSKKLSDYVKENIEITVFLKDNLKDPEIEQLKKSLDAKPSIKTTEFITKELAAKRLKDDLGEDFVSFLGYNPLLPSIDIRLHAAYANPDSLRKIERILSQDRMVKEVYYQKSLVNLVNDNLKSIGLVIIIFSGLLALIAVALINNTIRLSLYSKRFLIKSMQLVGATQSFIRRPFVNKGILHGLYGALVANVLLSGVMYLAQQQLPELFDIQDIKLIATLFMAVATTGIIISWISTSFAVRKYLRLKMDDLYY
jgi:cell division transport system permease protein